MRRMDSARVWMAVGVVIVCVQAAHASDVAKPRPNDRPAAVAAAASPTIDHTPFDRLLRRFVRAGLVDYRGIQEERTTLDAYLQQVRQATPAAWDRQAQLAFWINAYNACVIRGVIDHLPLQSVKDVDGFFEKIHYDVAGRSLTLNEIEAEGRKLGDWRSHFGVVCASSSCPLLRSEAYVADRLDAQLADQTRNFLQDRQRGQRIDGGTWWVSKIFDWYAGDFVPGQGGLFRKLLPEKLLPVLQPYLDESTIYTVSGTSLTIKFLSYDWTLNSRSK